MTHVDSPGAHNRLTLQEKTSPSNADPAADYGYERRSRYIDPLRHPQPQLEFVVDGTPLLRLLRDLEVPEPETYGVPDSSQLMSVADLAHPGYAAADLRRLAGDLSRDDEDWPLESGRLPLYVCPVCGALACGAITVAVTQSPDVTTWSDFRLEDGYTAIGLDLSGLGPFSFRCDAYREVLLDAVGVLDAWTPTTGQSSASTGRAAPYVAHGSGSPGTDGLLRDRAAPTSGGSARPV
ncbi:hypothetical protein [Aquipuribacter sp. MA13-6]|uniref:hypothetical protein n=1 Tax=unclassified Aquipuribacter TaxID=2635084 RepID=UPI003EEC5BC9